MEFGHDACCDDHRCRSRYRSGSGDVDDNRDIVVDKWLDSADRDSGDAAVDRGDAGESVDHQGRDAAVHRYRYV